MSRVLSRNVPRDDTTHSLSQFWQAKSHVQMSFQISQDYYPDMYGHYQDPSFCFFIRPLCRMGQLVIINAPSSFTFIWSIIKPWLAKETIEKVDILGKDYKEVLLQIVDADNLPTHLGGNCTCSGAGGCDLSSAGPWMEERLAKRATAKEGAHSAGPSECSTPTQTLSEQTSSTGRHVEGNAGLMNAIHRKVLRSDLTAEVVTAAGPEVT